MQQTLDSKVNYLVNVLAFQMFIKMYTLNLYMLVEPMLVVHPCITTVTQSQLIPCQKPVLSLTISSAQGSLAFQKLA